MYSSVNNYSVRYKTKLCTQCYHLPQNIPQVDPLAQTHRQHMFSPCASTVSRHSFICFSWRGAVTQCMDSEELEEGDGKPSGLGTLQARLPGATGKRGAASFLDVQTIKILHHWKNIHSWAVVHRVILFVWSQCQNWNENSGTRLFGTRKHSSSLEKLVRFFLYTSLIQVTDFNIRKYLKKRRVLVGAEDRYQKWEAVTFNKAYFCLVRTPEVII